MVNAEHIELSGGCETCARARWESGATYDRALVMHVLSHRANALAALRSQLEQLDPAQFLQDATQLRALMHGSSFTDELWAAAMTLRYGPSGLHRTWLDENERPTAEALERLPAVASAMRHARERLPGAIDSIERQVYFDAEDWGFTPRAYPRLYLVA